MRLAPGVMSAKLCEVFSFIEGDQSEGRTAATNPPVRTVFVIGPDKKINLTLWFNKYCLPCLANPSCMIADEATGTAAVVDPHQKRSRIVLVLDPRLRAAPDRAPGTRCLFNQLRSQTLPRGSQGTRVKALRRLP